MGDIEFYAYYLIYDNLTKRTLFFSNLSDKRKNILYSYVSEFPLPYQAAIYSSFKVQVNVN